MIDWGIANPAASNAALLSPLLQDVATRQQYNATLAQTNAQTGLIGAQTQGQIATTANTQAGTQQIEAQVKQLGVQTAGDIIANKAAQFKTQVDKFNLGSSIFSSVALNPSQASYDSAMTAATKLGIDTSDAPPMWGAAAQAYVQNKSIMTGQALDYYKAQYGLMVQRANVVNEINKTNAQTLSANAAASRAGIGGQLPITATSNIPQPSADLGGVTSGDNSSPVDPNNIAINPAASGPVNQPGQTQGTDSNGNPLPPNTSPLLTPSQLAQQAAQQKSLSDFQSQLGQTDAGYANRKRLLAQAGNAVNNLPYTNPIVGGSDSLIPGNAFGRTQAGESLENASAGLGLSAFNNNISQSFKRAAPQVIANLEEQQPTTGDYQSTNQLKVNAGNYINEGTHAMSLVSPYIAQTGQTLPQQSQLINKAFLATGAVNTKTGAVDMVKLATWPQFLPKAAQQSLQVAGNDGSWTTKVTPAEIDAARKKGASDADIVKIIAQMNGQ